MAEISEFYGEDTYFFLPAESGKFAAIRAPVRFLASILLQLSLPDRFLANRLFFAV